jgi:hypothetical protein
MAGGEGTAPAVLMVWRDDIHPSWTAPTVVMDATMPIEIVRQFFPAIDTPRGVAAPKPHTYVRQITDRPMTAEMLIPSECANERTNATRRANVERVRQFILVRADDVRPGSVLVITQLGLEKALMAGSLPANVTVRHFNDIAGENAWRDVALVVVIGRTEPAPRTVERTARALFGAEVQEIPVDHEGAIRYPRTTRGIRMRTGRGVVVEGPYHPDPRAEAVRWAICEAQLVQAIGRGRGVNRTDSNPLQIDILTDPKDWLTERLGEVVLLAPEDDEAEGTGAGQPAAPASRCVFESRIQDGPGRSHEPVYTDSIRYDVGVPASAEVSQFIPLRLRSLHIESAPEFMVALPSGRPRWFVSIDHSICEVRGARAAQEPGPDRPLPDEGLPATVAPPPLPSFYAIVDEVTGGGYPMEEAWLEATRRWLVRSRCAGGRC